MSKYSNELKLEVVKYYLKEHHSLTACSKKFNIKHKEQIRKWIKKYELYGAKGLLKRFKSSYDGNFKQNVVEYMHNNDLSAVETAYRFNVGNNHIVNKNVLSKRKRI